MRISDWSSDVCSSDLHDAGQGGAADMVTGNQDAADVEVDLAGRQRAQAGLDIGHLDQFEVGRLAAQVLGAGIAFDRGDATAGEAGEALPEGRIVACDRDPQRTRLNPHPSCETTNPTST